MITFCGTMYIAKRF